MADKNLVDNNPQPIEDARWMAQALDLARKGVGLASPNPTVGCVLISNGEIVGSGFHNYEQRDHAEIVALRLAGDRAQGATAYVTLEPCSHQGRTGPCADALIAAGVSRVVVATADANTTVHGRGIEKLQNAGIEVISGVMEEQAQSLNNAFAKYIRTGIPYVTLKAAMSLDGRIAPPPSMQIPGQTFWITGPESRHQVQLLRHSVDAVITGIGTVLADDPLLTDRSGLPRRRPLFRVVLDSHLRLPLASKLAQSKDLDVIVFCSNAPKDRVRALSDRGISVREIEPEEGNTHASLARILKELGTLSITSVLVEAGSRLNANFLNAAVVDRLYLFYAPSFLGSEGQPVLGSSPSDPLKIRDMKLLRFGTDFAYEARLNNPWQPKPKP